MRALAHPLRLRLLEELTREGPLTATEAAELLGESPANCSFHLRTLAKYGFVTEAEGGSGRARPWQRTALGISLSMVDHDDEASLAAHTLAAHSLERALERVRAWSELEAGAPPEWRATAFADNFLTYLTPEELHEVEEGVVAVVSKYQERTLDVAARPPGSRPVAFAFFGHPLPPSPSGN
jgi:DNA-binding transcriptional ArsR family regulator